VTDEVRLRREALEWREVEGEIVALDVEASEYVSANRTGAVLWRELSGSATRESLVAALTREFEVDEQTAARDVDRFLETLRQRGLLAE
jgi:Coenzyme PQQ synthesis protein D (PqqD)